MVQCRYVKKLMTDAGLHIREDAMGNIYGRWEGSEPDAGVLLKTEAPFKFGDRMQACCLLQFEIWHCLHLQYPTQQISSMTR